MEPEDSTRTSDEPVVWVSPAWLAEHQQADNLMVIDCRPNVHDYFYGHIPGAVHVQEGLFRVHLGNIPARWIPQDMAEALFGTLGVRRGRTVVIYAGGQARKTISPSSGDGLEAGFVAYSFIRYGHTRVCILNGGFSAWQQENRPVTQEPGWVRRVAYAAHIRENYFITCPDLLRLRDLPDVVVLDNRPSAAYAGQAAWSKPGHIPGAVNFPAFNLVDDRNTALFKSRDDCRNLFLSQGITPDKTVICSCGAGRTAATVFLILKWYLGYPHVLLYEGGFAEWTAHMENPVVTGMDP